MRTVLGEEPWEDEAPKKAPKKAATSRQQKLFHVVSVEFGMPMAGSNKSRIGKIARNLKEHEEAEGIEITGKEVKKRIRRFRQLYNGCTCTPEALEKHWSICGTQNGDKRFGGPRDFEASDDDRNELGMASRKTPEEVEAEAMKMWGQEAPEKKTSEGGCVIEGRQ